MFDPGSRPLIWTAMTVTRLQEERPIARFVAMSIASTNGWGNNNCDFQENTTRNRRRYSTSRKHHALVVAICTTRCCASPVTVNVVDGECGSFMSQMPVPGRRSGTQNNAVAGTGLCLDG